MAVNMSKKDQDALSAAGAAWNEANARGDQAGMDAAHAAAEAIRNNYGYSGGADGSQYIATGSGSGSSKNTSGNSQYTPVGAGDDNWQQYVGMTAADRAEMDKWGEAWNNATTQSQKDYAHAQAEAIREKYGYSGGGDGSEYIPILKQQLGGFTFDAAPTYNDKYSDRIDELLNQILNRDKFSYDANVDPLFAQYKEQYTREGDRAMQDTLGQVSARTGGLASSYAQTAAQQTNQYYMQQLADKVPELYQIAYDMYLDDIDLQVQDLGLLQGVSDTAYNRYRDTMSDWRDDRNFAYGVYRDDIADGQWQTSFDRDVFESDRNYDYNVGRDKVEDARYDQEWAHQVAQDALAQSQWEKEFGLSQSKFNYQKQQDAVASSGGSGGSSGGSGGSGSKKGKGSGSGYSGSSSGYNNGSLSASQVKALQKALGVSQDGYYGPASQKAAGGLSAEAAYKKYVGGSSGSSSSSVAPVVGMGLGLGPTSAQFIQELAAYGGIKETSNGFVWSPGWSATNYKEKLAQAKSYNPFGSILSKL